MRQQGPTMKFSHTHFYPCANRDSGCMKLSHTRAVHEGTVRREQGREWEQDGCFMRQERENGAGAVRVGLAHTHTRSTKRQEGGMR